MTSYSIVRIATVLAMGSAAGFGEPLSAPETLVRYLNRSQSTCRLEDRAIEMDIQASLPKLKKQGTMHGLKVISSSGQVAYRFLRFTGDKLIKTDVIARFLTAEAQPPEHLGDIAITRGNYKFHFQRTADFQGTTAYVYQLHPKKKRAGLFKGELWLDGANGTPLRESGELVKSPSIFIQHFRFVRDYPEHASCVAPNRTSIMVQTRIAGNAEMVVLQHPVADTWQPEVAEDVTDITISTRNDGNQQ